MAKINQISFHSIIMLVTIHCLVVQINSQGSANARRSGSVDPNDIKFYLYPNPNNEDYREQIEIFNTSGLLRTSYNKSRPLIILIPGLSAIPATVTDVGNIKNAYLSIKFEANIIIVDYSSLTVAYIPYSIPYLNFVVSFPGGILNSFRTGRRVSDFIRFLIDAKFLSGPEVVHLIGMSSGCYVVGKAGETIAKSLSDQAQIGRITGLDCPNSPMFKSSLEVSDAKFVDIYYTMYGFVGAFVGRVGHIDFYINGGNLPQPLCQRAFPFSEPYCSHFSVVFYFAKSIRNRNIFGCKCAGDTCTAKQPPKECRNKTAFGQFVNLRTRGDYYVDISK